LVYASVLAKAGKKVVLLDSGPDWQLSDLISSEIWGRRVKPAGARFAVRDVDEPNDRPAVLLFSL